MSPQTANGGKKQTAPSPLTATALKLAADGWPVFPCKANKKPLTENGFKDASTDRETIETAFKHPRAKLIGVPTGATSGFDAVDLDPRHGSEPWRHDHIARLPDTRIHRTPGKDKDGIAPDMPGEHWLFQHFTGVVNDQNGNIADGVDVRGEGGYIIAAGPGYSVTNDGEIAPWPLWLLEKALKLKQESKATRPATEPRQKTEQLAKRYRAYVDTLLANVRNAGEGQKHGTLLANARSLGGILAVAGISEADAHAWLIDALPASVADWNAAKKTATDGLKHGQAAPFDLEERPQYRSQSEEPRPHEVPPEPTPRAKKDRPKREARQPTDKPVIKITAGELHTNTTSAEDAIIQARVAIFQRGRSLVQPISREVPAADGRTTMAAGLSDMNVHALVDVLCAVAEWERYDARADALVRTNPPTQVSVR